LKKMRANVTNDDDRRRFSSLGGGNDDKGTWPNSSPAFALARQLPLLEKKRKTRANVAYDRRRMTVPSAAEGLLQVKGPCEGVKKPKNNHSSHLPHGGSGDNDDRWKEKKKVKNTMHLIARDRLPATQESLSSKAAATGGEWRREKKKKKRVDYVLTMEQKRSSGTHFPRKRPRPL
jgi:hypothetical protein